MKKIVLLFLLYFVGLLAFCGSNTLLTVMHWTTLAISITSFIIFVSKYRWSYVTFWIFCFAFIYPVYASIQSYRIFDQPFFMGVASLRYLWFILFGYFLLLINYDYRLLIRQINYINIFVASFSILAILILGIDPSVINSFEVTNNVLNIGGGSSESIGVGGVNIRGTRFAACSDLMFISMIYYTLSSLKIGGKKNWIPYLIILVYIIFVHKGRQPLALVAMIYIIYFLRMKGIAPRRMLMIILPIIAVIVIISYDESVLFRFATILDSENSEDFSTLARIKEVEQIMPYIKENLLLGVGNLSAHFRHGGFQTFFGHQFYLSDLGIIAVLATGGILLTIIYVALYISLWKKTRNVNDENIRLFMRFMLIGYLALLLFFFNDILCVDKCIQFALLFYPLFRQHRINSYIKPLNLNKDNKYIFI